jgi:hypothetical protein
MAKPRVFVSSTYYDLKHLRSSLENFIDSLGFEPILSEKGDIAFSPNAPLDESCYREVTNTDIFVLILGGRYGAQASTDTSKKNGDFFGKYNSITKMEYEQALKADIPIYILIENDVYSEYRTFLKNKQSKNIVYAHVDSVNIFHLIEEIMTQRRNNLVFSFSRFSEIQEWLKEQWAGLFRELLKKLSSQQQISSLSAQVAELKEINKTLKNYLEVVVSKMIPHESEKIIKKEGERLEEAALKQKLMSNQFSRFLINENKLNPDKLVFSISRPRDSKELFDLLDGQLGENAGEVKDTLLKYRDAQDDFNELRSILNLPPIRF